MIRLPLRTALAASACFACIGAAPAADRLVVIANGETVGALDVTQTGGHVAIHYDVKNNGRGPTLDEAIDIGADGLPTHWTIDGTATFGGAAHEAYDAARGIATWRDSTGEKRATLDGPKVYIGQNASPWALGLYARALLKRADHTVLALPGGAIHLDPQGSVAVGKATYRAYFLSGIDLSPALILLDANDALFAVVSSDGATVRAGHEAETPALTEIATRLTSARYVDLQKRFAHHVDGPVRIRNVHVFDPASGRLSDPVSVVFFRNRISSVEPLDSPPTPGEAKIDGKGGTLMPGLHDMHAHLSLESALLYIASGVTSVRDMGNDNAFLLGAQAQIEAGTIAGPRIVRNGFLEGRSPYSARLGTVVDSEAAALEAVRWYAARGYWQIKIYNSMNPAWVPAIAREAHRLGMTVTGHVPAFTNADAMIDAGYDEVTHINQVMLGWVLKPEEDTRTPLRLTAMRRTAGLDLAAPRVQATLDRMAARHIAHDPTAVTLELLMLSRDGTPSPAVAEYIDHLPIGLQRRRRQAIAPITSAADDAAYRGAFAKVKELLKLMHDRGIRLLPGTDDGTGLSVHRELEIYAEAGISVPEVLRLGTLAPEQYFGRDQELGTIARGKLADFILLPGDPVKDLREIHRIGMVVKDGTIYFPSEIWPAFGVTPFAPAPKIAMPAAGKAGVSAVPAHDPADEFF
ncbi:amidohydrolase [Sphingomonas panacis]|uniref:Amidohydrolase n=1 Tax=Sphingomonas panacis TaxID=1560345 RepID=A0A1B3Z5H4_9SPHN|nr:amidohydrolase family protein [Sphingomonas panacis]AOH82673.1 amidohydrolase [Sphingomonas panacis]